MLLPSDPPVLISDEPNNAILENKGKISTCSTSEITYTQRLFFDFSESLPLCLSQFTP